MIPAAPLTLGTAGHIDHGKTALVGALTGVDTDRLPEEKARGISIALGYAPLELPSGRRLSLVDVPGHERFVRTMVAGATGVDLFLLVVAADDGVMPQTREHVAVLRALGVRDGCVAVTKSDLAAPDRAVAEVRELLGDEVAVVPCSSVTGAGVAKVAAALDAVVAGLPGRGGEDGPPVLHVDRAFTVVGRGVVVTGTLWSGALAVGDELVVLPGTGRRVRVRGLQVHDEPRDRVDAGQRVAVNLSGVKLAGVARGDVLTAAGGPVREARFLDCVLALRADARHGERVQVHHGTRDVPGRLAHLDADLFQLRLEKPLLARDGDRVVVRRQSPPDTLGGGTVLDASAVRHGRRPEHLARLRGETEGTVPPVSPSHERPQGAGERVREGDSPPLSSAALEMREGDSPPLSSAALEVERRLREELVLSEAQAADDDALRALRKAGRAVRVSGLLYAHAETVERVRALAIGLIERDGAVTLGVLRDELGTGRRAAQAFLEHLDAARVTRRRPDDSRVLRRPGARA